MKRALWGLLFCLMLSPVKTYAREPFQEIDDGIPDDMELIFELVGMKYNICPELLESIAYHESRFEPSVKNKNCYGLMQVDVKVHEDRIKKLGYTKEDMLDAYKNVTVAADLLKELYDAKEENAIVLSMYAGDLKAIDDYKNYGLVGRYAEKVLDRSYKYEDMHGKHRKVGEW